MSLGTTLHSPLTPNECERRLRESVGGMFSAKSVRGTVGVGAAALRKRIGYRNSFQTVLAVEWSASDLGTSIVCNARLNILVIMFLSVWFGLTLLIGGAVMVAALSGSLQGSGNSVWAQVPIVIIGGLAIVAVGRFMARDDESFLLKFVREVLDAS